QGSGFRVQGSGFRVQGSGFRVQWAGFSGQDSGGRIQGAGFRVLVQIGCGIIAFQMLYETVSGFLVKTH
ncbi:MAG: hypothetical protein ABSA26_18885, partial [Thermoguttaceae bacterium]